MSAIKERIVWMDYAKAAGIWLVVVGHMPFRGSPLIYLFHMPLFFMLSGYLFKPVGIMREFVRSVKALLIPYLMYSIVLLLVSVLADDISWNNLLNVLLGNSEKLPSYIRPLWFLVALFIMRCTFSCAYSIRRIEVIIAVSIIFFIVTSYWDNIPNRYDYFQLQTTILCMPFFGGGILLNKYNVINRLKDISCKRLMIAIFVGGVAFVAGYYNSGEIGVNVFRCIYGNNLLLFLITATYISVWYMIVFARAFTKQNRIIEDISVGTLLILAIHPTLIAFLKHLCLLNTITSLIISILMLVVFGFIIRFTKHRWPIVIGRIR